VTAELSVYGSESSRESAYLEVATLGEQLSTFTDDALEALVGIVYCLVRTEVSTLGKSLAARVADERLLAVMSSVVGLRVNQRVNLLF
jgi:hypothetical protein